MCFLLIDSSNIVDAVYIKHYQVIYEKEKNEKSIKAIDNSNQEGIAQFFIKYYCLISAMGVVSNPVYLFADPMIPEGDIEVVEAKC
jgi:hypothetical protein